jgi:hypothetical protein
MSSKSGVLGRTILEGARVYLSGPMDFVASRGEEQKYGWRTRVGAFLRSRGCVVFDPWEKPRVRGLHDYGREGADATKVREAWTFENTRVGAAARSRLTGYFWETLHIDLRMVDTSDFVVAYCPTNIYSVGTPHEVALARQQRKPVLLVSPPVECQALEELRTHLTRKHDADGVNLLKALETQVPIKANPRGIPSLWYMPLIGGQGFFDGFGFDQFRDEFRWTEDGPLDEREKRRKPTRPLLQFLDRLTRQLPKKWDAKRRDYVRNDDWLLWDFHPDRRGAEVVGPHAPRAGRARGRASR